MRISNRHSIDAPRCAIAPGWPHDHPHRNTSELLFDVRDREVLACDVAVLAHVAVIPRLSPRPVVVSITDTVWSRLVTNEVWATGSAATSLGLPTGSRPSFGRWRSRAATRSGGNGIRHPGRVRPGRGQRHRALERPGPAGLFGSWWCRPESRSRRRSPTRTAGARLGRQRCSLQSPNRSRRSPENPGGPLGLGSGSKSLPTRGVVRDATITTAPTSTKAPAAPIQLTSRQVRRRPALGNAGDPAPGSGAATGATPSAI